MFQQIDLRELAEMQAPERAFVSLYVAGRDGLGWLDRRERQLRGLLAGEPDELTHFDESMKLVRGLLAGHDLTSAGLCAFACWANDFARGYPLAVPVPNLLRLGPAPYLRPLAELRDEYENFLVVAADNSSTRVLEVTSAAVRGEEGVRGDVKNRVKKGGWSQARYARRRGNQLHHYAKEVAGVLADLCRRREFSRIVMLGTPETTAEIRDALPAGVAAKVVGEKRADLHAGDQALMGEAFGLYFAGERESEARLWDRVRAELFEGGLAVAGAEEVLDAARVGRVAAMIVTRDAKLRGVRCRDCEYVTPGTPPACGGCGSGSVYPVDLVDELTRQLELTGAEVEFSDPLPGLSEVGGVAALLRY